MPAEVEVIRCRSPGSLIRVAKVMIEPPVGETGATVALDDQLVQILAVVWREAMQAEVVGH